MSKSTKKTKSFEDFLYEDYFKVGKNKGDKKIEEKRTICISVSADVEKEFRRVAGLLGVSVPDFIAGLMEDCINDNQWRENIQ
jgi:hypothetical protein